MSLKVRQTLFRAALSPKYMHLSLYYNYKKVIDIDYFSFCFCLFVRSRISTTRLHISGIMWRWSLFELSLHLSRLHDNSVVSRLSWLPSSMRYMFYLCFIIRQRNHITVTRSVLCRNWQKAEKLCCHENERDVISLEFNPLNWSQFCTLGTEHVTVWTIEKSEDFHVLKPR